MQIKAASVTDYIEQIPEERKEAFYRLRKSIADNLPEGFEESAIYGMITYDVPHSLYPAGYHCTPNLPLPFMAIASQKNFIALYHMGLYANENLLEWFVNEYPKHVKTRLDMGKSCIRFKKPAAIPFDLIAELTQKMSAAEWIDIYERQIKK